MNGRQKNEPLGGISTVPECDCSGGEPIKSGEEAERAARRVSEVALPADATKCRLAESSNCRRSIRTRSYGAA